MLVWLITFCQNVISDDLECDYTIFSWIRVKGGIEDMYDNNMSNKIANAL